MEDNDKKSEWPIHLILGASEYSRIKTETKQNLLWNVLVRNRLQPIALTADIKQAFLQVRIRAEDRDVLRFHWIKNKDPSTIEVLRFMRALFGLVQSPFLLAGTLKIALGKLKGEVPCRG